MSQSKLIDEMGPFTVVPNTFIEQRHSSAAFVLFVVLRYHTNQKRNDSKAFPSYETLRDETGLSFATIAKALKELIKDGWVERKKRFGNSTIYTLKYPISPLETEGLEAGAVLQELKASPLETEGQSFKSQRLTRRIQQDEINQTIGEAEASRATLNAVTATPVATYGVSMTPTPAQHDMLEDTFNRHLKAQQKPNETIIKAWNLQPHLEQMCLWFAEDTGVIVTKADKGKWSAGARSNNELHPTRQQHIAAVKRFKAQRNKDGHPLTLTHPQALYQTLKQVMEEQTHVQQAANVDYVSDRDALGNIVERVVTR